MKESTVSIWHPNINGEFEHMVQIDRDGVREFYTGGVFIGSQEIDENGLLKEDHEFNRPKWMIEVDKKLAEYEHGVTHEEVEGKVISVNGKNI